MHLPAKKSLGQHFLIDPRAQKRIAEALGIEPGDTVIEIGPGTGLLTRHLLETPLSKLIAFELDRRAIPDLREQFQNIGQRFDIREQDFLDVDLNEISMQEEKTLRVVGNIPYYITSPILFKLIDQRTSLRNAVLLVQREVAERLTASVRTKAYGIPTVLANFFAEVELLFRVPRGAFCPVPNVDSAVVRIDFERDYFTRTGTTPSGHFEQATFRAFVRAMFAARRKTIRNNLKSFVPAEIFHHIESRETRFLSARAEELTIPNFLEMFDRISPIQKEN